MPLRKDKLPARHSKFLRPGKLSHFQAERFTQLNRAFDIENGLTAAIANVDMDWAMVVAVEEESVSVLLENCRHHLIMSASAI